MICIPRLGCTDRNSSRPENPDLSHGLRTKKSCGQCVSTNRNLRSNGVTCSRRGNDNRDHFSTRYFRLRLSSARYCHRRRSAVARSSIRHDNPPDPLARACRSDLCCPLRYGECDGLGGCVPSRIGRHILHIRGLIRNRVKKNFLGGCLNRQRPRALARKVRIGNRGRDRICPHGSGCGITARISN